MYDNSSPEWGYLETIWVRDFMPVARALGDEDEAPPLHTFDQLRPLIPQAVGSIVVRAINGSSTAGLDYQEHAENGLSVIAVGGAKLSRGLTLEGLSISYYLRDTRMYDTLMQMGRWFGYRPGYLDLCRVYTTPDVIDWYQSIATATEELLGDFHAMQQANSRPKDFGLRVRLSPGMLITSQARMRNGLKRKVNFGGERPEITTFEVDLGRRKQAIDSLDRLLHGLETPPTPLGPGTADLLWRSVPGSSIVAYFRDLSSQGLYPNSVSARPAYLAEYVERRMKDGGLTNWSVLLKSTKKDDTYTLPLAGIEVGLADRTDRAGVDRYAIKSLIGSIDESADLPREAVEAISSSSENLGLGRAFRMARPPTDGLLILYLLNGDSVSTRTDDGEREPAKHIPSGPPFAAFCVSFPNDPDPENNAIVYTVNSVFERGIQGD